MKRLRQVLVCLGFVFLLLGMFGSIAKSVRAQDTGSGEELEAQFVSYGPATAAPGQPTTLRVTWDIRPGPDGQPEEQAGATVRFLVDDHPIGDSHTDSSGTATFVHTFSSNDVGTHQLTFTIFATSSAFSDHDTISAVDGSGVISVEWPFDVDQPAAVQKPVDSTPTPTPDITGEAINEGIMHAILHGGGEFLGWLFEAPLLPEIAAGVGIGTLGYFIYSHFLKGDDGSPPSPPTGGTPPELGPPW